MAFGIYVPRCMQFEPPWTLEPLTVSSCSLCQVWLPFFHPHDISIPRPGSWTLGRSMSNKFKGRQKNRPFSEVTAGVGWYLLQQILAHTMPREDTSRRAQMGFMITDIFKSLKVHSEPSVKVQSSSWSPVHENSSQPYPIQVYEEVSESSRENGLLS